MDSEADMTMQGAMESWANYSTFLMAQELCKAGHYEACSQIGSEHPRLVAANKLELYVQGWPLKDKIVFLSHNGFTMAEVDWSELANAFFLWSVQDEDEEEE